jgi:hypothetical protein
VTLQLGLHRSLDAYQEYADAELAGRFDRTLDLHARRVVSSHRVKSNRDHLCSAETDSGVKVGRN